MENIEHNVELREDVPNRIGRSAMNWLRDPSELPIDLHVHRAPDRPPGYYVPNDLDWPARICGSLSFSDVLDVVKGLHRLESEDSESSTAGGDAI